MTEEEIDKRIEEVEKIFSEKDSKWDGDNAWQGLQIIANYFDTKEKEIICAAEHDQFWSVEVEEAIVAGMTNEEFENLAQLNWMIDEGALSCFV